MTGGHPKNPEHICLHSAVCKQSAWWKSLHRQAVMIMWQTNFHLPVVSAANGTLAQGVRPKGADPSAADYLWGLSGLLNYTSHIYILTLFRPCIPFRLIPGFVPTYLHTIPSIVLSYSSWLLLRWVRPSYRCHTLLRTYLPGVLPTYPCLLYLLLTYLKTSLLLPTFVPLCYLIDKLIFLPPAEAAKISCHRLSSK